MNNNLPSDRKCYRIESGLYRMDQWIAMKGQDNGYDASGAYWIVGCIKLLAGQVWFLRDGEKVFPSTDTFIMSLPQHSVISGVLKNAVTVNSAVFSKNKQPDFLPREAVIFPLKELPLFRTIGDVETSLKSASHPISIQRCSRPNIKSLRLMKYLSENFKDNSPLPELAKRFDLAPSVLSRTFKKDWGKAPIHFRNYLRILDSFRHLAEELAITDTAYEVGFNDLSRFMKQFKKTVGHTPNSIQKRSKNAK